MIAYIVRFIKRVGVLIPGLLMVYVAAKDVFPEVDKYFPSDVIGIFITYAITAYVLIPLAFRLLRLLIKPKHLPLYCTTPDGFASDPLNVGIVATKEELMQIMRAAGWHKADRHTPKNVLKMVVSIARQRPYPSAPFSTLYLFGRKQDIGFELPIGSSPSLRHHVRFWAITFDVKPRFHSDVFFWHQHRAKGESEQLLWIGAVSQDIGIRPIRHNAQMTHMIHPDTDAEREFFVDELQKTGLVHGQRSITVGEPYRLRNRVLTGYFHADGKVTICELEKA